MASVVIKSINANSSVQEVHDFLAQGVIQPAAAGQAHSQPGVFYFSKSDPSNIQFKTKHRFGILSEWWMNLNGYKRYSKDPEGAARKICERVSQPQFLTLVKQNRKTGDFEQLLESLSHAFSKGGANKNVSEVFTKAINSSVFPSRPTWLAISNSIEEQLPPIICKMLMNVFGFVITRAIPTNIKESRVALQNEWVNKAVQLNRSLNAITWNDKKDAWNAEFGIPQAELAKFDVALFHAKTDFEIVAKAWLKRKHEELCEQYLDSQLRLVNGLPERESIKAHFRSLVVGTRLDVFQQAVRRSVNMARWEREKEKWNRVYGVPPEVLNHLNPDIYGQIDFEAHAKQWLKQKNKQLCTQYLEAEYAALLARNPRLARPQVDERNPRGEHRLIGLLRIRIRAGKRLDLFKIEAKGQLFRKIELPFQRQLAEHDRVARSQNRAEEQPRAQT